MLCDPPYHLTSGNPSVDWSAFRTYKGRTNRTGRNHRGGFMGQKWDGGNVAFRPETWATLAELLYPGAFVFAFASTRGWHRQAVAMEDAGLRAHPSLYRYWAFGSGFPKATRVDRMADRSLGVVGEYGDYKTPDHSIKRKPGNQRLHEGYQRPWRDDPETEDRNNREYLAASDMGRTWKGYHYGGQALKPAVEPILCFQKPYESKQPIGNITELGSGALNIDGGRIEGSAKAWTSPRGGIWKTDPDARAELVDSGAGRWPANLILEHTPECNDVCASGCPVKLLGEQSGIQKDGFHVGRNRDGNADSGSYSGKLWKDVSDGGYGSGGTAARFFYQVDWTAEIEERLGNGEQLQYIAKASTSERDAGVSESHALEHDGHSIGSNGCGRCGLMVKANGSGIQCNCGELRETVKRSSNNNPHPTVKPIALTQYLSLLLLPPKEYAPRRLLVPFAGSGSEMIGALTRGWDYVQGIELEAEYAIIAQERIAYHLARLERMARLGVNPVW